MSYIACSRVIVEIDIGDVSGDSRRSLRGVVEEVMVGHSILSIVEIRVNLFAPVGSQLETSGNPKVRNQDPSELSNRLRLVTVSRGKIPGCAV